MGTPTGTDSTCATITVVVPSQRATVTVTSGTGPRRAKTVAGEQLRLAGELLDRLARGCPERASGRYAHGTRLVGGR